jgi:hypothetical protein
VASEGFELRLLRRIPSRHLEQIAPFKLKMLEAQSFQNPYTLLTMASRDTWRKIGT